MTRAVFGTLERHADFASRFVALRPVDVWLPLDYDGERRFPVVYAHDGQNLFDPQIAYGGVDWGIAEAMAHRVVRQAIVVGIWNSGEDRKREYMPQKALDGAGAARFAAEHGGEPTSDAYLRFVVDEVKPFVDRTYRTVPGRESTLVLGSSMGGLISLYALCEYPEVFSGAGCVSTHWPIANGAVVAWLPGALPPPGRHRIYFDYGTETLDVLYEPYQRQVDQVMVAAGYEMGRDWVTRKFEGEEHSEQSWRERVHIPLGFLLGEGA
jgi:predicted alpha/beta superfamily hydrolase